MKLSIIKSEKKTNSTRRQVSTKKEELLNTGVNKWNGLPSKITFSLEEILEASIVHRASHNLDLDHQMGVIVPF